MPRLPIDYSKTIIYKIVCNDLTITEVYVGHTTAFKERKSKHKHSCNTESNRDYKAKVYQYIRENGGWDNFSMIEIEKYPCNDFNEARARERYWYEELNANLNTKCPTLDIEKKIENKKKYDEIYNEINKERKSQQSKYYRETHKDHVKEMKKQSYEKNKNKPENIEKRKKYCEEHKKEKYLYDKLRRERLKNNNLIILQCSPTDILSEL